MNETAINTILNIWFFLRRKKTLNFLLYTCMVLIARELTNIFTNIGPFFDYLIKNNPDFNFWIKAGLKLCSIIFSIGNWTALIIYLILFVLIAVLKYFELNSVKNRSLIDYLKKRVSQLESEKTGINISKEKDKQKFEKEKIRILESLKRQGVSTEKLIREYDSPLNAILISYASQHVPTENGGNRKKAFLRDELNRFDVVSLGGTDFLIPPNRVPTSIKTKEDLETWFDSEILKGRFCKIKFMALIDLSSKVFWKNYLPYTQVHPRHYTIGEQLRIDQLFTEDQIKRIALGDIIKSGDLLWLSSTFLTTNQQHVMQLNQKEIEEKLNKPSLNRLASDKIKLKLIETLQTYFGVESTHIATQIIEEAKYWKGKI